MGRKFTEPPDYYSTDFTFVVPYNHTDNRTRPEVFYGADFAGVKRYLVPPELGGEPRRRPMGTTIPQTEVETGRLQVAGTEEIQTAAVISGTIQTGEMLSHTLALEGSLALVQLAWASAEDTTLTLVDPSGEPVSPSGSVTITHSAEDKVIAYLIQEPAPGFWIAQITVANPPAGGEHYQLAADVISSLTMHPSTSGEDITDQGIDPDGNGRYDALQVTLPVSVRQADEYLISARLTDAGWRTIASVQQR